MQSFARSFFRRWLATLTGSVVLWGTASAQEIASLPDGSAYVLGSFFILMMGLLGLLVLVGFGMRDIGVNGVGPPSYRILTFVSLGGVVWLAQWLLGANLQNFIPAGGLVPSLENWFFWHRPPSLSEPEALSDYLAAGGVADPSALFFFQLVVAMVPILIMGAAISGRIRQTSVLVASLILAGFFFPVLRGWAWGGGFLTVIGFVDQGGAGVLHLAGGSAALSACLIAGLRPPEKEHPMPPSAAGAALGSLFLFFGLLALEAGLLMDGTSFNQIAIIATGLTNILLAAVGAVFAALFLSTIMQHRADELLVINAAIGGLVAMSVSPTEIPMMMVLFVGMIGGLIVTLGMSGLQNMGVQDPAGVVPTHLFCAVWGLLIAALYDPAIHLSVQIGGVGVIMAWSLLASTLAWIFAKTSFGFALPKGARRPLRWPFPKILHRRRARPAKKRR